MKKYELTDDTIDIHNQTLYRIRALKNFADIKAGDIGGYIEKEYNLSHEGDSWIYDNAKVYGDARVSGNVFLNSNAWVSNEAQIYQDADYTIIQGFGTKGRTTTFYRCSDGKIRVNCGCFSGTIDEFREQVKKTREGKIAEEYLEIADLMERHFE